MPKMINNCTIKKLKCMIHAHPAQVYYCERLLLRGLSQSIVCFLLTGAGENVSPRGQLVISAESLIEDDYSPKVGQWCGI
jgi:hypothetical protein